LLFVHGAYATARCWDEYFLPYFNHRGFDCHALDLSGHGDSEGRERLDRFGIDDYVEDLTQVAQELPAPAIVIGHSMGTVVVERFLEQSAACAAILMAPVPPGGILGASMKIALTQPAFFSEQLHPAGGEQSARTMRGVYYSRETEIDDLMRFAGLVPVRVPPRHPGPVAAGDAHWQAPAGAAGSGRRRRGGRGLPACSAGPDCLALASRSGGDPGCGPYADARCTLASGRRHHG
jgi:pimeloyl-ACP methyl ester carboxylesterase